MPTYDRRRPVHSAGGIAVQAVGDAGKVDDWKLGRNDGSGKFCRELAEVVTSGTIYLMLSPNAGHEARQMRRSVRRDDSRQGGVLHCCYASQNGTSGTLVQRRAGPAAQRSRVGVRFSA